MFSTDIVRDPFARRPRAGWVSSTGALVAALDRQWRDLSDQLDDEALTLPDEVEETARRDRLWDERAKVEAQLMAMKEPTIMLVVAKLRMVSWYLDILNMLCDGRDGVRTNELSREERFVASALADAERLAEVAP